MVTAKNSPSPSGSPHAATRDAPLQASSARYKQKSASLPFPLQEVQALAARFPTPFHLYDESRIRETCRDLYKAFQWVKGVDQQGFRNYFAVKALPNPNVLVIVKEENLGMDCSSLPELLLSESIGLRGDKIFLTSNNTTIETFRKAKQLDAIINLDDISHIEFLQDNLGLPDTLCFRYNPGPLRSGNQIIGKPEEAKFGLTRDQLFEAYKLAQVKGVKHFGLHTMVVSNCLEIKEIVETARMVFTLAVEVYDKLGIRLEFVNLGGGIGIPYLPSQEPLNFAQLGAAVQEQYKQIIEQHGKLHPLRVICENGRCITGPSGCLVTRVIHQKNTYRRYIGVDAAIANLMRPALYKAYHHMTVIPCEDYKDIAYEGGSKSLILPRKRNLFEDEKNPDTIYDVVGSLCENNDKLAEQRSLGVVRIGDLIVVHDTGAHAHTMGFNYNGLRRSAEYLKPSDGTAVFEIRRAEGIDDLFATIRWIRSIPCHSSFDEMRKATTVGGSKCAQCGNSGKTAKSGYTCIGDAIDRPHAGGPSKKFDKHRKLIAKRESKECAAIASFTFGLFGGLVGMCVLSLAMLAACRLRST